MKNYRWIALFSFWMITFVAYLDRVNLSVSASTIMQEFNYSGAEIGLILGAMMPGYIVFNFVGGFLIDRYNPLKVTSIAIVLWSLFTGWFSHTTTFVWMYISRVVFGAAEGILGPGTTKLYANWMLPQERGRASSGSAGFGLLGMAICAPFCGYIIKAYGWQTLFMISCAIGIVFVLVLNIIVRSTPREHPWVTSSEKDLIEKSHEEEIIRQKSKGAAAGKIATKQEIYDHVKNPYLWLLGACYLTILCIWWGNLSWLPAYLVKEKGFTVFRSGIMSAFPYLMGVVGLAAGGYITDRFMRGRRFAYIITCQLLGPPVLFIALSANNEISLILAFSVSMFFVAGGMGQFPALSIDLFSVKMAGISSGILIGLGAIGGLITPIVIGRVYDMTNSFYWGFGAIAIVTFIGAMLSIPMLNFEKRVKIGKEDNKEAISV